jgi:hypothetical protein
MLMEMKGRRCTEPSAKHASLVADLRGLFGHLTLPPTLKSRNANCAPGTLRMPARSPRRSTNDLLNTPGFLGAAARFWQVRLDTPLACLPH